MDGSGEAYQYLIRRMSEALPDIAIQVSEEVGRGRIVLGSKLPTIERLARDTQMEEANVGKLAKADVVSVEYSDDEKLSLLISAIKCLAETMQASRQAVDELRDRSDASLVFEEPDGSGRIAISLHQEVSSLSDATGLVNRLLLPALDELGQVP